MDGMTEREEFKLKARLVAHELLLRDMLLIQRAQLGAGKRLGDYRKQLKKSAPVPSFSELDAGNRKRMNALVRRYSLDVVDSAVVVLREERRTGGKNLPD